MMNVIDGCVELQCGCHDDWYMREYSYSENVIVTKKKGGGGQRYSEIVTVLSWMVVMSSSW